MICQKKWANQTEQTKIFLATEDVWWAKRAWHSSFLSGPTSETPRTLTIMPWLIASSLRRMRVKNKERNHMVTSQKSEKKRPGSPGRERFPKIRRNVQRSLSFIEHCRSPRVKDEEEAGDDKHLPFAFFGTSCYSHSHFPALHSASVHCGEQQFAFTPSNTTANSSFWISLPWVLWPRHRLGTNPPLLPKFPWDQKGKGQGYKWWTSLCQAECCKLQKTDVSLLLLQIPPFVLI